MMIVAGVVALIPAVLIAMMALSKKTGSAVRRASIIALIIIGMVFITCVIMLIAFGPVAGQGAGAMESPVEPVKESKNDILTVLVVAAVVLFFLIMVIILSIRERREKRGTQKAI
ncbi:MAG: hypothetical protein FWG27_02800 [Treponema sp.]|jgi:preprotein translocase subunit SecG|nr:hypothetical protein [Treponema sp.]